MRLRSVGLLAVLALVFVSCGGGGASGPSEGIEVHGDWTIDIYNEDGSLDRHVEFSNDLTAPGKELLARALGGVRSLSGDWEIALLISGGATCDGTPTCEFSGNPVTFVDNETLRLAGAATVDSDGVIQQVNTSTFYCDSSTAPVDCDLGPEIGFTATALATPQEVAAGQSVQVQVDISTTSG